MTDTDALVEAYLAKMVDAIQQYEEYKARPNSVLRMGRAADEAVMYATAVCALRADAPEVPVRRYSGGI